MAKRQVKTEDEKPFHMGNCNASTIVSQMKRHLWLMVYMTQYLRWNTNEVWLTEDFYVMCSSYHNVSESTIKRYIAEMIKTGLLKPLRKDKVVLHPDTFFRGKRENIRKVHAMRCFMGLSSVKKNYDALEESIKVKLVKSRVKSKMRTGIIKAMK